MVLKDKAVAWFFQHYIIPRSQIIDRPGFVIFKVSYKTDIYSRQVVMPESILISLEKEIVKIYGNKGKQVLYSTGKKFGYRFASISHVVKQNDVDKKSFLEYINILSKFVEGTYASKISTKVNLNKQLIDFELDNFVVCRKSGLGYLISFGGIPGIWSYMLDDSTVEAIKPKCQGRGDKRCRVISAPGKILKEMNYEILKENNLKGLEMEDNYKEMNKEQKTEYSKNSFKDLIDFGILKFKRGIVSYDSDRYFIVEISLPYLIETELKKLKNGENVLFKLSFDYGKELARKVGKQEPCKFIMDFMSALGWGDILAREEGKKYVLYIKYFPWTKWYKNVKFTMFSGIVSGIFSGFKKRNIIFKMSKKLISNDYLTLILREK